MSKSTGINSSPNNLVGHLKAKNEIHVSVVGTGARGEKGLSAYELWLEEGNEGTIQDFFDSLASQYKHPETHSADMIIETDNKMFLSKEEKEKLLTTFIYEQRTASREWNIVHDLDKHPSVTVVDTAGTVVVGNIEYISKNEIVISFTAEFSGRVFLN